MSSRQRSDDRGFVNKKYGRGRTTRNFTPNQYQVYQKDQDSQNFFGSNHFGRVNQSDYLPNGSQNSMDKNLQNNLVNYQVDQSFHIWSDNDDLYRDFPTNETSGFDSNAIPIEDEPFMSDEFVTLDWYNSDLNLEVDRNNFCSGKPISNEGFGYMWAGARANYGATRGKVCYEVIINSNNDVSHLNEVSPHILRCGWSIDESSLQLGEEGFSYAYDGTAKAIVSNKFEDYGKPFGFGDVIGCYLDLDCDPVNIGYTLNGEFLGIAFSIQQSQLSGRALFPHICSKNQEFTVNFGQLTDPLMAIIPQYIHIGQLEMCDGLFHGSRAPKTRQDCEMIMLIGLPGSGKTFFAEDYKINNSDKRYNILGISSILDKMSCMGMPRKLIQGVRWDNTIRSAVDCLRAITTIAATRRRNYIFDQANVSPKVRERKIQPFNGFQRKAFVVLPTDDIYMQRIAKCEMKEGKEIPKDAVFTMKANFVLPEAIETMFDEVVYTELGPREAARLVESYNNEAWRAGYKMSRSIEHFVDESLKYRNMMGINGPIGKIINDVFFNEPGPYVSARPDGFIDSRRSFDGNDPQKLNYSHGPSFTNSTFYPTENEKRDSLPPPVRHDQQFKTTNPDSFMSRNNNYSGIRSGKNYTPSNTITSKSHSNNSRRYSPNHNNDEDSDIEIIKETNFINQPFRDRSNSPNARNFGSARRSRSRSQDGRPNNNRDNFYGHRRNDEFGMNNNDFGARNDRRTYNQGNSTRGTFNTPVEPDYKSNNKDNTSNYQYVRGSNGNNFTRFNNSNNIRDPNKKGANSSKFTGSVGYFTKPSNTEQNNPISYNSGNFNDGYNNGGPAFGNNSQGSFNNNTGNGKYRKEGYPNDGYNTDSRDCSGMKDVKFVSSNHSNATINKRFTEYSDSGSNQTNTSIVNKPPNSTNSYNASFVDRSKSDKRPPSFTIPSVVPYPKGKQSAVPPAPHIRPLSEVKVPTPPIIRSLPYEGSASYESAPPIVLNFKHQDGPTPPPVPPPSGQYSGYRKNSNMENRSYPNISYPKY
ncbi:uncharacterized protein [Lepeophtheirus salmonis]|uniref:uncharacterized protein isoform X1 n=2 Tax=Lepeophtheirus salmonis TaxID=72036 RepID=UPI001AE12940|nr:heterogeneous nuclear ribonucleoprotein U-like isoform X1 [Lepeophtheirus salmonis]XP_040571653.1 heterogeneous nuclear ribonucleoprotein U-like isoform X1 [Lepeophtheirus salmonis]XP_040571654.1 heterogeneous nuclear ribonucleoprotein U-like isoform X1 [Lepeophtheirus salmonis]